MNIVEPILFQARYQPEVPALCALGNDIVTYARLRTQMNNVARRALSCGLKRGSVVALSIDQPLLHAAVILGLTQAGIVPVSVVMQRVPAGLKIDAIIGNTDYPHAREVRHLPFDFSWIVGDGAAVEVSPSGQAASEEICRIILTSGTTGSPKAVALTHGLAMARNARFEHLFGSRLPTLSRIFLQMGVAASFGYYFLTYCLGRGGTLFFHGDSVENTLRAFAIFQIQAMLATPSMLVRFLAMCDRHRSIDINLDTIVSTGSQFPQALLEQVRPRLCAHLITGYGATETARTATAPAHQIAHIEGAVGFVTPGARIEIVDTNDRPVPAGTEGIVRVASEFSVDRYIDDAVESARYFRGGWFYPGDIGSLGKDNLLIIAGRQNNVLNAGGDKMSAEMIEAALVAFKGIKEAAVFTATSKVGIEEVWAAVASGEKIEMERLRTYCWSHMPPPFVPAHVVSLDALPIDASGKVDRKRLKKMLVPDAQA
jgi:acyl-CoA synthetase (AMP-forming)/AMP-acid ligase II